MIKLPLNSSTLPPSHLDFDVYTRTRRRSKPARDNKRPRLSDKALTTASHKPAPTQPTHTQFSLVPSVIMPGVWSLEGGLAKLQEHVQSRGADCMAGLGRAFRIVDR